MISTSTVLGCLDRVMIFWMTRARKRPRAVSSTRIHIILEQSGRMRHPGSTNRPACHEASMQYSKYPSSNHGNIKNIVTYTYTIKLNTGKNVAVTSYLLLQTDLCPKLGSMYRALFCPHLLSTSLNYHGMTSPTQVSLT